MNLQPLTKESRVNIRPLILAMVLTLALVASAPAAENGCQTIPWGSPIASVEAMTFSHTAGGVQYYRVTKTEPCSVFDIQGAEVAYGFRQGRLFTVLVEIDKVRDLEAVVATLMDAYGLPDHKKDEGWDVYRWETDDLKVKLKSQFATDRIKIGMYYKPLIPQE